MCRVVTFIGLVCWAQSQVFAQTAAKIAAMPMDQFIAALERESVSVSTSTRDLILKAVDPAALTNPDVKATCEKLRDDSSKLTVQDLLPLMTTGKPQSVCVLLSTHEYAVVRFVANGVLAGSGDTTAAKKVYSLIHSEKPSPQEKRIIKTFCVGLGIHPESDTAEDILTHFSTMMAAEPLLKAGDDAPDFSIATIDGNLYSRDEPNGKTVVLHFWSTWCGPCMVQLPGHHDLLHKHAADDFVVFFVNLDSDRKPFDDAVANHKLTLGNVFRGKGWGDDLVRTFGINSLPHDLVIDETGRVIHFNNFGLAEALAERKYVSCAEQIVRHGAADDAGSDG